ncbi:MAG: hypothetical protein SFV24_17855 [Gemmatimonadales bacterium]|jgi:hypothetical protein|nr:hypothetical protein [Gemmatimonadales bacterium]
MTLYNVHLYREMRLLFTDIEAESPEAAAATARDKLTGEAAEIDDCDGQTLAALVDEIGDSEYERSVLIDFEQDQRREADAGETIVAVSVRGGLIEDVDATDPVTVVVEDWDVTDEETASKPARVVHILTGRLSGPKVEKLRRLISND